MSVWLCVFFPSFIVKKTKKNFHASNNVASNKFLISWWLWVQIWFRVWIIFTTLLVCLQSVEMPYSCWYWKFILFFVCLFVYIFLYIYSLLSNDDGSPRVVRDVAVGLVMKLWYRISIRNIFVIQPFLIRHFRRSSYFSDIYSCTQSIFFSQKYI